jgi:hypothetical protein
METQTLIAIAVVAIMTILPLIIALAPELLSAKARERIVAAFRRQKTLYSKKIRLFIGTSFASVGSSVLGSVVYTYSTDAAASNQAIALVFAILMLTIGAWIAIQGKD